MLWNVVCKNDVGVILFIFVLVKIYIVICVKWEVWFLINVVKL